MKKAKKNVTETKEILLKSINFAMGVRVNSAEPFERMFRDISNIRDVLFTPSTVIDTGANDYLSKPIDI